MVIFETKMTKKSRGRQKVEMVKMHNESNLQVTFSKRRSGLFKKASELCTLCGVDVAIIVFSPGKKVFSFGHPSVETVIDRFITRKTPQISGTMQLVEAHRNASVRDLNMQLTQVLNQLEAERRRGEELNQVRNISQKQCWWTAPIEELNPTQLEQLKLSLKELKKDVTKQGEKVLAQASVSSAQYFPFDVKNNIVNNNVGFNHNVNLMPPPAHQPRFNTPFGHGFM